MRLHVIHIAYLHGIGGVQARLIDLLTHELPSMQYSVYSPQPISLFWQKVLQQQKIPMAYGTGRKDRIRNLVRFVRDQKIRIAHFHTPWPEAIMALKTAGVQRIIEHDHGKVWYSPSTVENYKKCTDLVDGIIALSHASRLMFIHRLKFSPKKITVIHNGIDFSSLSTEPVERPDDKKVITTVCRMVSVKGVDSLIQSIPLVTQCRSDVVFWLIGDGPLLEGYKKLADQIGISDKIFFWGAQENVGGHLTSSDIFVLPSYREPFGNVLVEAGYFSLPVIATNVDGIPEIVVHGKTGILINPTKSIIGDDPMAYWVMDRKSKKPRKPLKLDPYILSKAILELMDQEDKRHSLGTNAHKHVVGKFSIERYCKDVHNYYKRFL